MSINLRSMLLGWLAASFMLMGFSAQAGMIGTESLVAEQSREVNLATVDAFMAGEQVQSQLEAWGVESDLAADRVANLSDAELQQLAMNIESQPAGGDAIAVIGIIFLVLLILELVGVTNVFTAI
ncbi:PA2779 family protein [Panacagrimonas sp.]|uniref:PA2779 family protein n=1 Tax=Panacagrimonas sp. TaxID=2480088 RepID=UPI003B52F845